MKKEKEILAEILYNIRNIDFKEVYAAGLYNRLGSEKESAVKHLIEERIHSIQITEEIKSIIAVENILEVIDWVMVWLSIRIKGYSFTTKPIGTVYQNWTSSISW